jgi:hypothetical protein
VEFTLGAAGFAAGACTGATEGTGAMEGTGLPKTCVLWEIA